MGARLRKSEEHSRFIGFSRTPVQFMGGLYVLLISMPVRNTVRCTLRTADSHFVTISL
jgi:hypothetical protein